MGKYNRITALLLAVILLLNTVGLPVYAEDTSAPAEMVETQTAGENEPAASAAANGGEHADAALADVDSNVEETEEPANAGSDQGTKGGFLNGFSVFGGTGEATEPTEPTEAVPQTGSVHTPDQDLNWYKSLNPEDTERVKDENGTKRIKIASGEDLIHLSYVAPAAYKDCILYFADANTNGLDATEALKGSCTCEFRGLGNEDHPFAGTVTIATGSTGVPVMLMRALFNNLSGSAQITNLLLQNCLTSVGTALLANNVSGTASETSSWSIRVTEKKDNEVTNIAAPLIGDMADGSSVRLSVENTTLSLDQYRLVQKVQCDADAGFLCATMGEGASLTLTGMTGSIPAVESLKGNAGALVGTMASGAQLSLGASLTVPIVTAKESTGGIVGSATDVSISLTSLSGAEGAQISGTNAGGLIGSYTYTGAGTTPQSTISTEISNITVNGSSNAGGVFGVLTNNSGGEFTVSSKISSVTLGANATDGNAGGLIGQYSASSLAAALKLTSSSVSSSLTDTANAYGGLVGWVSGDDKPAYLEINAVTVTASGNGAKNYGGLVASLSEAGHMVKVGAVTTSACKGSDTAGGLVGYMPSGVLCLSGEVTTGVSQNSNAANRGWILGKRDNTLVYSTYKWTPKGGVHNDIGNWGQVLSVCTESKLEGLVTQSGHTVEVCAANGSYTIGETAPQRDFAAIALRLQLDNQETGALKIPNDISGDAISVRITLETDVDLTGTGFTGFQRDFEPASINATVLSNQEGTLRTITLPGITVYCGTSHNRQGLFAKTSGLEIKDVAIGGSIPLVAYGNDTFAGGAVAESQGTVTLTNVKSYVIIPLSSINIGNKDSGGNERISGLVAYKNGGSVTFTNCEWDSELTNTCNNNNSFFVGGFLARTNGVVTIEIKDSTIKGKIEKSAGNIYGGGLVGSLIDVDGQIKSKLTIDGLTVDGVEIAASGCTYTGGLLGWEWMDARIQISGVVVKNSTLNAGSTDSSNSFGGLVYKGSGYWTVKTTDGVGIKFAAPEAETTDATVNRFSGKTSSGETSGLFVGRGDKIPTPHKNALYLVIPEDAYLIESGSVNLTLTGSDPKYFDEIIGVTISPDGNNVAPDSTKPGEIAGNGIVSIETSNGWIYKEKVEGESEVKVRNTYKNQLSTNYQNPNTRYYYNLDTFRAKAGATDIVSPSGIINSAGRMVLFSAYTHCHSGLQKYFYSKPGKITGDLDLTGYSYYPAEQGIYVDIDTAEITFDYKGIESREQGNKPISDKTRQHYGMHTGIFGKVENNKTSEDATLNVTTLTLSGTVGGLDSNYGALIRDNAQGSGTSAKMILEIHGVNLDGICIDSTAEVRPLLINSIGSFTTLNMSGVETLDNTAYTGLAEDTYAASSLIGAVGGSTGQHIQLTFSDMALDGRTVKGKDTVHNTYRTIFSRALFLEEFCYTGTSSGNYNFTNGENAKYTLGQELSNTEGNTGSNPSGRNNGEQYCFFDSTTNVCSIFGEGEDPATYFSSYRRYVYQVEDARLPQTNPDRTNHELDINLSRAGLTEGCGTYSHPYVIDTKKQLENLSQALSGNGSVPGWTINVDTSVYGTTEGSINAFKNQTGQHSGEDGETKLTCDNSAGWDDVTKVQLYLRNAYYQINKDIEIISSDWSGLGSSDSNAFCGVIDGNDHKITIKRTGDATQYGGLINFSMGSVVKDLTIVYEAAPDVTANDAPKNTSDARFFGGVVGWCLGGDTIIDNVTISGLNTPTLKGTKQHLVAVGGYVGMVGGAIMSTTNSREKYGGGVVFRNMTDRTGMNSGNAAAGTNYFYSNPYVGRVLDGYVISEDTELNNTDKNYKIPNFTPDASYLEYDSEKNQLLVNNAEGLWLLSAIANSGASSIQNGENLAYTKGKARIGAYEGIGTATADLTDEGYLGGVENKTKTKSYLTQWDSDTAPVFYNLNGTAITIVLSDEQDADFDMSSFGNGFRGIGASYATNADGNSNHRLLKISGLVGNGNTVTLAQNRKEYTDEKDNWTSIGSGLFVLLRVPNNGSFTASNLTLKGSTGIAYYNNTGPVGAGTFDNLGSRMKSDNNGKYPYTWASAGMFASSLAREGTIESFELDRVCLGDEYQSGQDSAAPIKVNSEGIGSAMAGGLVGALTNGGTITKVVLRDCTYNELTVKGRLDVGGLLGYVKATAVELVYTSAKTLKNATINSQQLKNTVRIGAGGLIGQSDDCKLTINNTKDPNIVLRMEDVSVSSAENGSSDNDKTGIGGAVGTWKILVDDGDAGSIQNVSLQGTVSACGGVNGNANSEIGGLIGHLYDSENEWTAKAKAFRFVAKNIFIATEQSSSLTVYNGRQIGGVIGMYKCKRSDTWTDSMVLENIRVGRLDTSANGSKSQSVMVNGNFQSEKGHTSAGGIIGLIGINPTIMLKDVSIVNAEILCSKKSNKECASGVVIGWADGHIDKDPTKIKIENLYMEQCTAAVDADNAYAGLLYGRLGARDHVVTGTNILAKDCTVGVSLKADNESAIKQLQSTNEVPTLDRVGLKGNNAYKYYETISKQTDYLKYNQNKYISIWGGNGADTKTVKLVGVSLQQSENRLPMKDFGGTLNTASYVIRSDYTGAANGVASDVTTKPGSPLGSLPTSSAAGTDTVTITGDGAAFMKDADGNIIKVSDKLQSIANQIWTDSNGSKNLNLKHYSQIQESLGTLKPFVEKEIVQFTDFNTAAESNIAANFPVISLQTSSSTEINNSLYACISLLSNWEVKNTSSSTLNYKLSLTPYKWNGNAFVVNDDPSLRLKEDDGKFYLNSGKYDNQKNQFNLIDVAYYDPSATNPGDGDVVYHLYIPVVVKKMFEFKFWASAKMGTNYVTTDYDNQPNLAIGSQGEHVTALLNFQYQRKVAEWKSAVNNGENLLWNFDHQIRLTQPLPVGTKLTLVDINNQDKSYYLKLDANSSLTTLRFQDFKDNAGVSWSPVYLCDELRLTRSDDPSPEGMYVALSSEQAENPIMNHAIQRDVNGTYYRLATSEDAADVRFNLNVGLDADADELVLERYYLTILTPEVNDTTNTNIECADRLVNPSSGGLPTKRLPAYEDTTTGSTRPFTKNGNENKIVLGNFVTTSVEVETKRDNALITDDDPDIPIVLKTSIGIEDSENGREFAYAYSGGQRIYQCFELSLQEYTDASIKEARDIAAGTEISVQFYMNNVSPGNEIGEPQSYYVDGARTSFKLYFPERVNEETKERVAGLGIDEIRNGVNVYAVVHLSYSSPAILAQFPPRKDVEVETGIAVFASSNISYSKHSLENTTVRTTPVEATFGTGEGAPWVHYYSNNSKAANLYYVAYENVESFPSEGVSDLGINGRDGTSFAINSAATYDVSAVPEAKDARTVQCKVTLLQKTGGTYSERIYTSVDVKDYLTQLDVQVQGSDTGTRSPLKDEELKFALGSNFRPDVPIQIPVDLRVITGEALEQSKNLEQSNNKYYANYEVRLEVCLLDGNGREIPGTAAVDYIVYTNAKIFQNLISASTT